MRNTRLIPDFPRDEFYAANPLLFVMLLTLISRNANRRSPDRMSCGSLVGPAVDKTSLARAGLSRPEETAVPGDILRLPQGHRRDGEFYGEGLS
jgi:hypothetical protein